MPIHIAAQSRAQLRKRWGDTGAAAILNNSATVLVFGGQRDPDDLDAWAKLAGERDEPIPQLDLDGRRSHHTRRVPVMSAAQISQLRPGRVLVIRRGMAPTIGRVQMAWKRRDVRAAAGYARRLQRAQQWATRAAAWAQTRRRLAERAADALAFVSPRFAPFARALRARNDRSRAHQAHHSAADPAAGEHTAPARRNGGPVGAGKGRS